MGPRTMMDRRGHTDGHENTRGDGGDEGRERSGRCLRRLPVAPPAAATSSSSPRISSGTTASAAMVARWPARPSWTAWPPRASTTGGPTTRTPSACRHAPPCSRASTSGRTGSWPTGSRSPSTPRPWRSTCTRWPATAPPCSARRTSSPASIRRTSGRRTPVWPGATPGPGAASSARCRPCTPPPGATTRSRTTGAGSRSTIPSTCTASPGCSRANRAATPRHRRRRTTRFPASGTTPTGWPTGPSSG